MYLVSDVEARASLVQPPALLRVVVSLGGGESPGGFGGVSGSGVGSGVGEGVTVGGGSETGGAGSAATPLTSLE